MHCLKCGTEIESPQVFCSRCLEDMKNCPVSRETPVVIPKRAAIEQERRGKRPGPELGLQGPAGRAAGHDA